MISYSVKIKGNLRRVQKDGCAALYLSVIINCDDKLLPLDLKWPAHLIDNKAGKILARNNRDKEYKDYCLIIQNELGKVNEIFKIYRIQDKPLSMDVFLKEYQTFNKRKDFLAFYKLEVDERLKRKEIVHRTWLNHMVTYNQLSAFKSPIYFYEIDKKFLQRFAAHLRRPPISNEDNTVWTRIKEMKTYIRIAKSHGIGINDDFENFKIQNSDARVVVLEDDELTKLMMLYNSKTLGVTHQATLRAFLFSCFTGLRVSDVQLANWGWVNSRNELHYVPYKTRRFHREVVIPLSKIALSLIERDKGKFFNLPTDQEMNRSLKDIAKHPDVQLNKHLTFHLSRHTFASNYYRQTKDVVSLQRILGHRKIEHTMIYVHLNDQDKKNGIDQLTDSFMSNMAFRRVAG